MKGEAGGKKKDACDKDDQELQFCVHNVLFYDTNFALNMPLKQGRMYGFYR